MTPHKNIDLRLLSYFHKSAELRNITKAAEALHVAQPTLSKAIKLLEYQLGAVLFERHTHGVELTEVGQRLLLHAEAVIAQVGYAIEEIDGVKTGKLGRVRVGAGPSWVRQILPEAVATLLNERPELDVEVFGGFDKQLLQMLHDGDCDFVVAERPLEGTGSKLEFETLSRADLVVCARKEHPLAECQNLTIERVTKEMWALPPSHSLGRQKLAGLMISLGLEPIRPSLVSNSQTFIFSFIRNKNVLTYTTRSKLQHPDSMGIIELDVPDLMSFREAGVISRTPRLLPPAAEYLVKTLKVMCRNAPNI